MDILACNFSSCGQVAGLKICACERHTLLCFRWDYFYCGDHFSICWTLVSLRMHVSGVAFSAFEVFSLLIVPRLRSAEFWTGVLLELALWCLITLRTTSTIGLISSGILVIGSWVTGSLQGFTSDTGYCAISAFWLLRNASTCCSASCSCRFAWLIIITIFY